MSSRRPLLAAAAVGVAVLAATFLWLRPSTEDTGADREGCVGLLVSSSTEKSALMSALAGEYGRSGRTFGDGKCAEVTVSGMSSGAAMEALARGWDGSPAPQVWTPTSSLWAGLLRERGTAADKELIGADGPSIARSPLAIAMPKPMAEALGWPGRTVTWDDILTLSTDPRGWGAFGHPEWGRFVLGKDNPHLSTSGLAATIAAFYAATGLSSDLTPGLLADPAVSEYVAGVESGVLHYSDDAVTYMDNLFRADAEGRALSYVSAVAVQEQLVHLYDKGAPTGDPARIGTSAPKVPLVALHPGDGTIMLDHPYFTLPGADADQRAAAGDFLAYLLEPRQQKRFTDLGFRDSAGLASPDLVSTIGLKDAGPPSSVEPPPPSIVDGVLDRWDDLRKKAQIILLVDVSGSMTQPAGDGRTRLEAAKQAATASLDLLHPDDEVGLWVFSTEDPQGATPYREVLPPAALGASRQALVDAVNGLSPGGGTALYTSIRAAHDHLVTIADPRRIHAVVVLSDGKNAYPADNDLNRLVGDLDAARLESTARVFPIAFGEDASVEELGRIAAASRTRVYDARDPALIGKVFTAVISNF